MKRSFSYFDAAFFFLLYFKARGLPFFGFHLSFFDVLFPYLLECLVGIIAALLKFFDLQKRFSFIIWRTILRFRVKRAHKAAYDSIMKAYQGGKASANPGQFQNPENLGK